MTKPEHKLKCLIAKKESYFKYVQQLYDSRNNLGQSASAQKAFLAKFSGVDGIEKVLRETIDEINELSLVIDPESKPDYAVLPALLELVGHCRLVAERISAPAAPTAPTQAPTTPPSTEEPKVRLPHLDLPKFDGEDLFGWEVFYTSFKSMIHDNTSLTNDQKVQYLFSKLSGRALAMFVGVPATGTNYEQIYADLVERFNDKNHLASFYINQLLSFRPLKLESVDQLNQFIDRFCAAVQGLKGLQLADLGDYLLGHIGLSKLDAESARQFQLSSKSIAVPTFTDLLKFVKEHTRILRNSMPPSGAKSSKVTHAFVCDSSKVNTSSCVCCHKQSHQLFSCNLFKSWPVTQRHSFVKAQGFCFNCLGNKHKILECKLKKGCTHCGQRHNTLLHFDNKQPHSSDASFKDHNLPPRDSDIHRQKAPLPAASSSTLSMCTSMPRSVCESTVLLGTVQVSIFDHVGQPHLMRMLLDSGSQSQFLSNAAVSQLGLGVHKIPASVKGIGGTTSTIKGITSFTFTSQFAKGKNYSSEAFIVNNILDKLPSCQVNRQQLSYLDGLPLADKDFHKPGVVHGIIGATLFARLLEPGKVMGSPNDPIAIKTSLGYVVVGSAPVLSPSSNSSVCLFLEQPLETSVSKFFELEEVPQPQYLSSDDKVCAEFFEKTYTRNLDGRYCVRLPFSEPPSVLGDSKELAKCRFFSLEKRLNSNSELHDKYHSAIQEFIDLKFMSQVEHEPSDGYFIPHHAVCRPDKVTTKVRCVMDASAKSTSGKSLNDILFTGEKLYTDLFSILLQFRMHSVAMTADIKKMFCQVLIHPDDQKFQRILWRFSNQDPLQTYEINRVTFGVKPSPYLSQRVLKQLSIDEAESFPLASCKVTTNFYMDDFVCSEEDVEVARELQTQMVQLCASGGFELVKWSTNSESLIQSIPENNRLTAHVNFDGDSTLKILGLQWHAQKDYFFFTVNWSHRSCTKRSVLSAISTIFDPLGFLQPAILYCKLLLSDFWKEKIDWDETPPADISRRWDVFQGQLSALSQLKIPRLLCLSHSNSCSILGFADASEKGYAAVIYCQSVSPSGTISVNLVCSKSKVAPLKTESIPRLELCAGLLLSNLIHCIMKLFAPFVSKDQVFCFLDSTVALDWIHSSPHRWAQFVANRVAKIQSNVESKQWFHIAGKDNPADCVSRGLLPSELVENQLFYSGPSWLHLPQDQWSLTNYSVSAPSSHLEVKKSELTCAVASTAEELLCKLALRFSSWTKLVHCVVYILRFIRILPKRARIELCDIQSAENKIIQAVQIASFSEEINALKKGVVCSPQIRKLNPFMNDGLIRVGGRLSNSDLGYEQRHPVLLPKKNHIVDLLIDHYHRANLHTGPYLLLSLLRQRYWIISGRSEVKKRVGKCNVCFKVQPRPASAKMADLPAFRVQETSKPFIHTGVDYCGPFAVTMSKGRGIKSSKKAYVCLFICLTTKAVHIELASDLSTEIFMNCFKRFLSRRGCCKYMYSDNGTNFIGAKNILGELYHVLDSAEYQCRLTEELNGSSIEWRTIPPSAPHMGGIWERQMRPIKTHLLKVIGAQILTYEEFTTVLVQIEGLLNSRPLCPLSSQVDSLSILTPAHFLHGEPLNHLPAKDVSSDTHVSRYLLLDQLVQCYWKRWQREYLSQLQVREKWATDARPVRVGDVVIIVQDSSPVLSWPLGVVQEVYPGRDGVSRTVLVRTKSGLLKRPVVKLCPLPSQ